MPGHLFTEYFLTEGIRATPEWRESVASADGSHGDEGSGDSKSNGVWQFLHRGLLTV